MVIKYLNRKQLNGEKGFFSAHSSGSQVSLCCKGVKTGQPSLQGSQNKPAFTARESRQASLHCKGIKIGQPSLQGSQDRSVFAIRESRQASFCCKGVKTGAGSNHSHYIHSQEWRAMPVCLLSVQLAFSILIQSGIQPHEWCYPQWVGFLLLVFLLTSLVFTLCSPHPTPALK